MQMSWNACSPKKWSSFFEDFVVLILYDMWPSTLGAGLGPAAASAAAVPCAAANAAAVTLTAVPVVLPASGPGKPAEGVLRILSVEDDRGRVGRASQWSTSMVSVVLGAWK